MVLITCKILLTMSPPLGHHLPLLVVDLRTLYFEARSGFNPPNMKYPNPSLVWVLAGSVVLSRLSVPGL